MMKKEQSAPKQITLFEQEMPASTKKPKEINPDIKAFIDWFFDKYQKRYGEKYVVFGADVKLVQRLLQTLTLDQLKAKALVFFDDQSGWLKNKRKDIKLFASQINRISDKPIYLFNQRTFKNKKYTRPEEEV